MKHIIPILVILLLLSSGFAGVSDTVEELTVDAEGMEQSTATVSSGPMDSAWPMKCHDLYHTGRSPYSTSNTSDTEKWLFETDGWIDGSIVIDNNGTLYFGGSYGVDSHGTSTLFIQMEL